MTAWLAERIGTLLLHLASRLLRYAERRYGPPVSLPPVTTNELPPRVEVLVEHLLSSTREEEGLQEVPSRNDLHRHGRVRDTLAETHRVATGR